MSSEGEGIAHLPGRLDLLVMCANGLRHKYFSTELAKAFPRSAILTEAAAGIGKAPSEKKLAHFRDFERTEREYFAEHGAKNSRFFKSKLIRSVARGAINDKENVEFVRSLDPRYIAVHSTSIIKEELIASFPKRLINLHAGLSPYYRGSGTNVFPFLNRELELVGMTVHYIDRGIDTGEMILQGRPRFEIGDNTHTIGCKNVILGTELMRKVIGVALRDEGKLPSVKQEAGQGKCYLRKHFTDEVIEGIRRTLDEGLVAEYLKDPKDVAIVQW